ncbi:helix-turn-helix domain-containing protein [Gordonibacter sp. 28C]|uniref:helix-turn-helix transcriptional regulator n=1 Tax=Gordonibacter sp. 28C TaxID=2078569 RepID=UPI001314EE2F|nr:helix-turn-helix domain-containing protein [Gordonibacter sp. 28C]
MMHESRGISRVGSMKLDLDTLIGFVGFASLAATVLALFLIVPGFAPGESHAAAMRIGCALALALAFSLVHFASHALASGRCGVLVVGAIAGLASMALVTLAPFGPSRVLIAVCGAALGLGALCALWFCFICARPHKIIPLFASAAVGAGVLVCMVESYLVDEASRIATVLVWAVSLVCLLVLVKSRPESVFPEPIENRESDKRSKILWTSALMLSISNFEFGYVLGSAAEGSERMLCLAVAAVVAVLLAINFARKGAVSERSLSPLTPPLTMFAFLSMYLFGDVFRLIALCILSALFTVYTLFGTVAVAEHVRISRLSALRVYGKARALDYVGVAVGFASGFGIAEIASTDMMLAIQASAAIAVAYGFVASYCHKARFPEASMEEGGAMPETKGLWKKRCRVVGEQCDLSERQFEVLVLVAQGRNAKYIEEALSISLSTAQTHIRNIYRKTGVHSRQELLNLIENTKLYGEE